MTVLRDNEKRRIILGSCGEREGARDPVCACKRGCPESLWAYPQLFCDPFRNEHQSAKTGHQARTTMVTAVAVTAALSPSPLRFCCRKLARPPANRGGAAAFSSRLSRCRPAPSALLHGGSNSSRSGKRMLHSAAAASARSKAPNGGNRRAKAKVALGTVTTLAAVGALAREAQLPDSFSEWDDQLQWEEVHELAQLSNMTHKDPQLVAKWFDCHQYTGALVVRDLPKVSNHYFVHVGHLPGAENRRVHHVAIRGTVSFADLSIDLKTKQVFDEECGCVFHSGFKEVADAVVEDLEQFLEPGAEVKVAGHSLGGAAAIIVAAKLKLRGHNVGKVMTFGAPMVTDAEGAAKLKALLRVMRVTHERDPVPLTPLESGSRTSAAALKLLTKSGGRQGGGQQPQEQGPEEKEQEDEDGNEKAADTRRIAAATVAADDSAAGDAEAGHEDEATAARGAHRGMAPSASSGVEHVGDRFEDDEDDEEAGPGRQGDRDAGKMWRVESSPVYSHFGSQVVLLRRKKCIECYREEIAATGSAVKRFVSSISSSLPLGQGAGEGEGPDCTHCPSRGKTFYDPKGEDGCLFDSPWLRLSHPNYTHRMNHYENEIAERLEHHLTRRNNTAPGAKAGATSSSPPPLEESGGVGGTAAAATESAAGAQVEEAGERSPAKELAQLDVR